MSLFSFLENTANTIGHDVSTVAHGNSAPGGGVFGFLNQVAQGVVNPISKVANEGVALDQVVTGNQQAAQRTLAPGGGVGHQGGVLGGAELSNDAVFANPQNIKKTIGTGASIASNVLPTKFGFLADSTLGAKVGYGALAGAGVGATGSIGATLANNGQLNLKQILQGAAAGATIGGFTPIAGVATHQFKTANEIGAIGKDVSAAPKPEDIRIPTNAGTIRISPDELNNLAKAQTPEAVKSIIGDSLPQEITDRIAPGIALRKDPNIIQNIIAKGVNDTLPRPPAPVVGNEIASPSVSEPVNPAGQGSDVGPQIISHLSESATPTREAQEAGYSAERSARLARSQAAGAELPGLEGHQAEATALAGALPKQEYSGLSHLDPEQQDNLFTQGRKQIQQNPDIQGFDKFGTAEALRKVIYGNGGVPQRGEIKLLQKAFGSEFSDAVQSNIHSTLGQKTFALWRAGLLTGPQTITKILTSHGVHEGLETLKDVPAAAVDKFASLISGNRSLALTLKGKGEGFAQGAKAGKELLTTGVDRNPGTSSAEFHNQVQFGNHIPGKVAQAYVDFVGRAHGALYKPFYGSAHLNSIYSTALAGAKNQGLRGAERSAFVENVVRNPSKEVLAIADHDAQMNSFQQQTALSQAAGALQRVPVIGKVLAPFTRIPAAIATDLINYSPVGVPKTIFEAIQSAKSSTGWDFAAQRKFSQGLGRSITGSAAIIPGMMLYNKGMMTLGYPTDPKEQQLWAQEGKQPNSVLVRGKWRSLGSLGPSGSVLEIGGHTADALLQGKDIQSALVDGFAGGAQSIEEQSYLRGVSGAVNALNDPGRYAASFEKQTAGSIIPTISNTVANSTDQFKRQTDTPLEAIKSRIPGQRESLPVKLDTFGNAIPNSEVGADRILDPFQSSTAAPSTPLNNELRRLQNAGQGIIPSPIKKVETFNGVKTPLTPQQVRTLQSSIGSETEQAWNQLVNDLSYKDLPDDQKKQLLTKYYDQIVTEQKQQFAEQIQGGIFSPTYSTDKTQSKVGRPYIFQ